MAASRYRLRLRSLIDSRFDLPARRSRDSIKIARNTNAGHQVRNLAGQVGEFASFGSSNSSNIVGQ